MKEILKSRNFIMIMSGKLISLMGNSIFDIAVIWYVLSRYGKSSGTMLGLIMVMAILPTVLLGSAAGFFIDRYNKKYIMLISDFVSGIVVIAILLLVKNKMMNSFELLGATGILAIASSTVRITVNSMIPEMFDSNMLYSANSVNQFIERGTALLGYGVGGALIAVMGVEGAILFNAITFFICFIFELFIVLPVKKERGQDMIRISLREDFNEVMGFIRSNVRILIIEIVFTVVNFFWDPLFNIATPYVMKNVFKITSTDFGLLEAAAPLGFCLGAIFFSKRPGFLKNKYVLFNSILGANILFTLFSVPIVFSGHFINNRPAIYYLIFVTVLVGIFSAALNISASVVIQTMVPDNIRGKFLGLSSSISAGLVPLGGIIVGALIVKINFSIIFIVSLAIVYLLIIIVPKSRYSYEM